MAALGDLSAPHSFEHRTAILLGMRAAAVQALTEIRSEFPERLWQLVLSVKIEALKVQHAETGRISEKAEFLSCGGRNWIPLYMTRCMTAARRFFAERIGLQRK